MAMINNPTEAMESCFAVIGREVVLKADGTNLSFDDLLRLRKLEPDADFFSEPENQICAISLKSKELVDVDQYKVVTIRSFFAENEEEASFRLARARALLSWRKDMHYCSCCGAKLEDSVDTTSRFCPECKKIYFPRIEPCIIVLVSRGNKVLLARHVQRNQDVYTCIAGFIEVGETAEHAVRREIFEEAGIHVKNVQYRGSQSWPFPDQLMLAFTAEYESGELNLQEDELSDAGWFDRENCPATPMPGSIAYRLIHGLI